MASAYRPWSPSTGPGQTIGIMPKFNTFQANGIGNSPGIGYNSNMGPQTNPNPGPPAPASEQGILLEPSLNEFIALETGQGGPAFHLVVE